MKKIGLLVISMVGLSLFLSLKENPPINKAIIGTPLDLGIAINENETSNINFAKSMLQWEGYKAIGGGHIGTVDMHKSSMLFGEIGKLTSAYIQLDMNTIAATDVKGEMADKLNGHLKSSDFFNVARYPFATIEIIELNQDIPDDNVLKGATHTAIGNLDVNGVIKSITFPVIIKYEKEKVAVISELTFDRTEFNVMYASDQTIKDKMINKDVVIKLNLEGYLTGENANSDAVDKAE